MDLGPASPTPLDPWQRRDDWRAAAAVVLAVLLAPGRGSVAMRGERTAGSGGSATGNAPTTRRTVRPPRAC